MRIPLVETYYTYPRTPLERFRDGVWEVFERPYVPGLLLLLCTLVALVWTNSPWGDSYVELFFTHVVVGYGDFALSKPLVLWINDGLMTIFFFLVGLEIKQEVLEGELSTWKKAALPIVAALGGMLMPALLFTAFNYGKPSQRGWAIPAATDIAFALGILSLLGTRVPHSLRIFLLSLAIADDIGAVLVIALFYTGQLSLPALFIGLAGLGILVGCNRLQVSNLGVYGILGIPIWMAFLKSGVHPTVAGVLIALTVPARERMPWQCFAEGTKRLLADTVGKDSRPGLVVLAIAQQIEKARVLAVPPLQRAMHGLHAWVNYGIMPLFALANAGVRLELEQLGTLVGSPVLWGVGLGLFLGKQLGVFGVSWVMVKVKIAAMPSGVRWSHLYGVSLLAGIGFTMALFIAGLAYGDSLLLLSEAKLGILLGSALSALFGFLVLWRVLPAAQR